ncbi:MAG TPA: dienelactone hydrolase family protein [Acidimicrobiales bacterium]
MTPGRTTPGDLTAETVTIPGHGGDAIEAYLARPHGGVVTGGVVVIHHMPGYDAATKEITRKCAANGYLALMPNLYSRESAGGADPDDAAAAARAAGGVPDERLVDDVAGAVAHLRSLPGSNGKVATIGFCSGGRQSFLAACSLDLDAAVDCYGAFVLTAPPDEFPLRVAPLGDRVGDLSCPLLGLFGSDDRYPGPDEVAEFERVLRAAGKDIEFYSYEGAGHAFFNTDRPSFRAEAALDGWERIWAFFGRHLSA